MLRNLVLDPEKLIGKLNKSHEHGLFSEHLGGSVGEAPGIRLES